MVMLAVQRRLSGTVLSPGAGRTVTSVSGFQRVVNPLLNDKVMVTGWP